MDTRDPRDISLPETLPNRNGPLVSVITPTYDDARYMGDALLSLSKQTYTNLEVVVVDGAGVDWLEELLSTLQWGHYVNEPPEGVAAARNCGLDAASGDLVAFLDADDYYAPEKLERQVSVLTDASDIVYSNVTVIEETGTQTELSALPVEDQTAHHIDFFRRGDGVPTVTVAARKSCFENERFDETLRAREDPHLWTRLFAQGTPAKIPEPLAFKRRRGDSLTSDPDMMYESELREIASLTERFTDLRPYREERERLARYRYGKQLFHAGRVGEARRVLFDVMRSGLFDHRTVSLFATSLLPAGNRRVYELLERSQEVARRVFR
jgi:glycosyltransferase involved in cell wall biosynthesis